VFAAAAAAAGSEEIPSVPLALIALGGYGRGELNPFSDVDVMLLHGPKAGKVSPYIEQIVEQILYLLWDIGFKVGHSTRSIKEAIAQANRDMRTKTAMLESRYLAGDAELARQFREQLVERNGPASDRSGLRFSPARAHGFALCDRARHRHSASQRAGTDRQTLALFPAKRAAPKRSVHARIL